MCDSEVSPLVLCLGHKPGIADSNICSFGGFSGSVVSLPKSPSPLFSFPRQECAPHSNPIPRDNCLRFGERLLPHKNSLNPRAPTKSHLMTDTTEIRI